MMKDYKSLLASLSKAVAYSKIELLIRHHSPFPLFFEYRENLCYAMSPKIASLESTIHVKEALLKLK